MRSGIATPASARRAPPASWARYRTNSPRHLLGISRDLQARLLAKLAKSGRYAGLRPSLGPLLALLWDEGRTLTWVADQLGTSKQACSQLANLAEEEGYVARRAGADDRRSKQLVLTKRGRALASDAVRILLGIELEYAELVGGARFARFSRALGALYQGLGIPTHASRELAARARGSIGVLPLIATRIEQELMRSTMPSGHPALKMSFGQVLPFIGPEGGRVNEIARLLRVSRQAISTTSRELEALGYLRRDADASDGRCVVLRLTPRGEKLIADSVSSVEALDARFVEILGARRAATVQDVARALYERLHVEDAIFGAPSLGDEVAPAPPRASEIEKLAAELRQRLGRGDAARLAALLEPATSRISS